MTRNKKKDQTFRATHKRKSREEAKFSYENPTGLVLLPWGGGNFDEEVANWIELNWSKEEEKKNGIGVCVEEKRSDIK